MFNLITGELAPDSGAVSLFGRDITRMPSRKCAHLGMARTYQIITLFTRDTIQHNVTLAFARSACVVENLRLDMLVKERAKTLRRQFGNGNQVAPLRNRPPSSTARFGNMQ